MLGIYKIAFTYPLCCILTKEMSIQQFNKIKKQPLSYEKNEVASLF